MAGAAPTICALIQTSLADEPNEHLRAAGLSSDLAGRDPITRGDLACRMAQRLG